MASALIYISDVKIITPQQIFESVWTISKLIFKKVSALLSPLHNLTQFGPIHVKHTRVKSTFQEDTWVTSFYPDVHVPLSSRLPICLFLYLAKRLTWCKCAAEAFSNRCLDTGCLFWLRLLIKRQKGPIVASGAFSDPIAECERLTQIRLMFGWRTQTARSAVAWLLQCLFRISDILPW